MSLVGTRITNGYRNMNKHLVILMPIIQLFEGVYFGLPK